MEACSKKTRYDEILRALEEDVAEWELVSVYNEYCEANNYYEERIYSMDEIDDLLCGLKPSEVLNAVGEDFNLNDKYFKENIYGLESSDYPEDDWIDKEEIAKYVDDNDDYLYCTALKEILDYWEDEEDEEDDEKGAEE